MFLLPFLEYNFHSFQSRKMSMTTVIVFLYYIYIILLYIAIYILLLYSTSFWSVACKVYEFNLDLCYSIVLLYYLHEIRGYALSFKTFISSIWLKSKAKHGTKHKTLKNFIHGNSTAHACAFSELLNITQGNPISARWSIYIINSVDKPNFQELNLFG